MGEPPQTSDAPALPRIAGPWLLWGLGVGYVVSGDYFGWNFGIRAGGTGGMWIATAIMAAMYTALVFTIAELATALPVAGGPYAFARRALGRFGGFITGLAVAIETTLAPAVIASGIAGYLAGLVDAAPGPWQWWLPALVYAVFVGLNLLGSVVSLRVLLVITAIASVAIVIWAIALVPVALARPVDAGDPWPQGWIGVLAALPAGGWFFLAIEGVPLAAEDARDPARDLPRAMLAAMATLLVFAVAILAIAPRVAGAGIAVAGNPLPAAIEAAFGRGWLSVAIGGVGLAGLAASMLSIVFAYSRQIYALARAGYLPALLGRTDRRHVPRMALVIPAVLGYLALVLAQALAPVGAVAADLLMQVAVFAALVAYALVAASHLVLRRRAPELVRPYRTPLPTLAPVVVIAIAAVALGASLWLVEAAGLAAGLTLALLGVGAIYYRLVARARVIGRALADELAIVRAAETGAD